MLKHVFDFHFQAYLSILGEFNINIFFCPFASKNIEKLQTNINGYELIINILLIATFLYKNDSIELRYSDYEDSFQFLSHFRRISSLEKGQTISLVQKPYFVALSGRASPTSSQSSHHTARAHFYSGNFM